MTSAVQQQCVTHPSVRRDHWRVPMARVPILRQLNTPRSGSPSSSRPTVVVLQHAAEFGSAADCANGVPDWLCGLSELRSLPKHSVAEALVRPIPVVVSHVGLHHVVEVPEAEAPEAIQALPSHRRDPRLGVGVGVRSHERRLDDPDPGRAQQPVEAPRELRVAVVDGGRILGVAESLTRTRGWVSGVAASERVCGRWRQARCSAGRLGAIGQTLA